MLARASESWLAQRISAQLQGLGVRTRVQTRAMESGRAGPALLTRLRRADAVVLLLSETRNGEDVFWEDGLVDAVRSLGHDRLLPVRVGPNAGDNLAWPIVADFPSFTLPDARDLQGLVRLVAAMLQPDAGSSIESPTVLPGADRMPRAASVTGADAPDALLPQALIRQQAALAESLQGADRRPMPGPLDDANTLNRWDIESQTAITLVAALDGLSFEVSGQHGDARLAVLVGADVLVEIEAPAPAVFQHELASVLKLAPLRGERLAEILVQQQNRLPFWEAALPVAGAVRAGTTTLLQLGVELARLVSARAKHAFAVPRPPAWSPAVMPPVPTPVSGSFPMASAVESYLIAGLLDRLVSQRPAWGLLAHRISENRLIAGLNFPIDAQAGRLLGMGLAEYLLARMNLSESMRSRRYRAGADDSVFEPQLPAASPSPILSTLGARALDEWRT